MVKDNELMRGNFVQFFDQHKIGHIAIVDQAMRYSCLLLYKGKDDEGFDSEIIVNYENIRPIKITKSFLKKNGWVQPDKDEDLYVDETCGFVLNGDVIELDIISDTHNYSGVVEYVHQLQNKLKACEIEREIII